MGDPPDIEKVAPRIPHWRRLGFPRRPLAARLELPGFNFGVSFGSLISSTDFGVIFVRSWVPQAPKNLSFHWKVVKISFPANSDLNEKFMILGSIFDRFLEPVGQNLVTLGMPVAMRAGKVAEGEHRPKALQGKGARG